MYLCTSLLHIHPSTLLNNNPPFHPPSRSHLTNMIIYTLPYEYTESYSKRKMKKEKKHESYITRSVRDTIFVPFFIAYTSKESLPDVLFFSPRILLLLRPHLHPLPHLP